MFTLTILRNVASGIPSSTWPFPRTTKNTQCFLTFLNLMTTAHVPNCMMFALLYVQRLMCFLWIFKALPLLHFYTIFGICIMTLCCSHYPCQFCMVFQHCFPLHVFLSAQLLPTNFCLNVPNQYCFYLFFLGFLCHLNFYFMHCMVPLAPAHLSEVAHLPASGTHLPICWALLRHMDPTTVSARPSLRCCV